MPFTPSHAVVALPLLGTPLIPAAIAVGAMTPDLPLFVRALVPSYATTHDPAWLPLTVAIALALLLVWRCVLRPATRALVPRWIAERLPVEWDAGARAGLRETFATRANPAHPSPAGAALVLVSLAIGVATHLGWDAFTHEGRWGTELIPALGERWGPLLGTTWLQHGSSVLALVVLAGWGARWASRRTAVPSGPDVSRALRGWWWLSLPLLLVCAWVGGLVVLGPLTPRFTVAHLAYRVLPPACAVWAVLTVLVAVAARLRLRALRDRPR